MAEPSSQVSRSQVIIKNALKLTILQEDGKNYKLVYIDSAGKMQEASTTFQLLNSAEFLVLDDSVGTPQEKEMASTGTDGSKEAQQIATKEENHSPAELKKKMLAMEKSFHEVSNKLKQEVEDLWLLLKKGDKEYKMENSRDSQVALEQTSEGAQPMISQASQDSQIPNQAISQAIQATVGNKVPNVSPQAIQETTNQATQGSKVVSTNEEKSTQRPVSPNDSIGLEMHKHMCSLSEALVEKKKQMEMAIHMYRALKFEKKNVEMELDHQTKEMEKEKNKAEQQQNRDEEMISALKNDIQELRQDRSERHQVWLRESRSLESTITELREINTKWLSDYNLMTQNYERHIYSIRRERNEDSTSDRPLRCRATTKKGRLCLRYAKIFYTDNHFCRQHDKLINGV